MIKPPALQRGDKVGIVAPAKFIPQEKYEDILEYIAQLGYKPIRGKTTWLEHGPFAGDDKARTEDMQQMLDDPEIKAVFCLRGGYGTIRIIDKLNFNSYIENPKWLVGFSDITVLHSQLNLLGIESIHGQMPVHFSPKARGLTNLFRALNNEALDYEWEPNPLNKTGKTGGQLVGGNLAILLSLLGTPYQIDYRNKILFIEEVGEYLYRFDRMMHQLRLAGILHQINGLIFGGLTSMEDNEPAFGQTAEQIISDLLFDTDYPVCFDFPAGHIENNQPLIIGRNIHLEVTSKGSKLTFD